MYLALVPSRLIDELNMYCKDGNGQNKIRIIDIGALKKKKNVINKDVKYLKKQSASPCIQTVSPRTEVCVCSVIMICKSPHHGQCQKRQAIKVTLKSHELKTQLLRD